MKRLICLILSACMLLGTAACGSSANDASDDPNLGVYTAATAEMMGFELSVDTVFEKGFTIELKGNGKCTMEADGKKANGKWSLDGTAFSASAGGMDCAGTLENGVMKLENLLDSGITMMLYHDNYQAPSAEITRSPGNDQAKTAEPGSVDLAVAPAEEKPQNNAEPAAEAPASEPEKSAAEASAIEPEKSVSEAPAAEPDKSVSEAPAAEPEESVSEAPSEPETVASDADNTFWIIAYLANGMTIEGEQLKATGMDQSFVTLHDDHTGAMMLMGETIDLIGWTDDGYITVAGRPMYPFEYEDPDTIRVNIYETIAFRMKRGAQSAETTDTPAAPIEAPAAATEPPAAPTEAPAAPTEAPTTPAETPQEAAAQPESGAVPPYGDSDGVIDLERLKSLYRWLRETEGDFRSLLTFDEISNAVGKLGFDKKDDSDTYRAAYWTDGDRYYVTVTFRNQDGSWTCSSITTGMPGELYSEADISGFPVLGSGTPAGSCPTESVTLEGKIGFSGPKVPVTAEVPTINWAAAMKSSSPCYYSTPDPKKVSSNTPHIEIGFYESEEKINFYFDKFENLAALENRSIGGIEMVGRSYSYIGMEWIEYYGQLSNGIWVSIKLTGVRFETGTQTEAIVNSISFGEPHE